MSILQPPPHAVLLRTLECAAPGDAPRTCLVLKVADDSGGPAPEHCFAVPAGGARLFERLADDARHHPAVRGYVIMLARGPQWRVWRVADTLET